MNYSPSTYPQSSRSMICPLVKLGRSSPPRTEPKYKMPKQRTSGQVAGQSQSVRVTRPVTYSRPEQHYYIRADDGERRLTQSRLSNLSISNELYWNGESHGGGAQDSEQSARHVHQQYISYGKQHASATDQGYHTLLTSGGGATSPPPPHCCWTAHHAPHSASHSTSHIDRLPDELLVRILSYLHSYELSVAAQVCSRWERLAWRPALWRTVTFCGRDSAPDERDARTDIRSILKQLCAQNRGHICLNIERVYISDGARITDREITFLARRCPELTYLQIHGCATVSNVAVHELLTRCVNLHHLDITGCTSVTTVSLLPGPDPVLRLALQYLDLTDCVGINDHSLRIIVKSCPQLVYLYLRRCVQITDVGLKYVPSFCSGLREFSVSDCGKVTDFGLYELAKLGAILRYLSVAKCDQVSDAGLKVIARRCYKLRYLNARGCEAVSDDAITVLARSCNRLRALDIGKCDVSDAGLKALAECCPNIKKLSLRNCDLVTDRGIKCIAYYCRGLQQLNIQDCQITIEGYRAVKQYCRRCIIEHTNPGFF